MKNSAAILVFLFLSVAPALGQYTDHRDHQLDSLESVVAPWTQERITSASAQEKDMLSDAFEELMWGYSQINPSRSLYFARKAYPLALQEQWLNQAFQAAKMIGQHHWAAGQLDSAKANFATALAIADRMALKEPLPGKPNGYKDETIDDAYSSLYGAWGNLYASIDSIPEAMEYYRKAGEIFEKNGWHESSATLYHNMGETWIGAGDWKQARECYQKALQYAEKADDPLLVAEAKAGFGALYMEKGKTTEALQYLKEADAVTGEVLTEYGLTKNEEFLRYTQDDKDENCHAEQSETSVTAPKLTDREASVLPLLAEGLTSKEIASKLFLSEQTIKWYRMRLLDKFKAKNTAEMLTKARDAGML